MTSSWTKPYRLKIEVFCVFGSNSASTWTVCPEDGGNVAHRNDGVHLPDKASLTSRQTELTTEWAVWSSNPARVRNVLSSRTIQNNTGAKVENEWSYASTPPSMSSWLQRDNFDIFICPILQQPKRCSQICQQSSDCLRLSHVSDLNFVTLVARSIRPPLSITQP
jgi:hypothetical protein